ncbi:MAG: DUF4113 domain-containing protein [Chlorobaculum sp.]|nr:DUF4113 domain-containing protein [Chlorobaculum sp.]
MSGSSCGCWTSSSGSTGTARFSTEAENSEAWKPQQTNLSPHFTTKWGEIIEVRGQ